MDRYWWMRAKIIGWVKTSPPRGVGRFERRLAVGDPRGAAAEHVADIVLVQAGRSRRPERDQERRRLLAVGRSRRRTGPARRRRAGTCPAGRPGSIRRCRRRRPALPLKRSASAARSAIPPCAMISCASGFASTRRARWSAIGGSPRPPWMRIGTRRSAASSKIGASRWSFRRKRCARGWSLIPRAPRSRQRVGLLDRILAQVEPDEGDEAYRSSASRTRATGRSARGRPDAGPARPCRT